MRQFLFSSDTLKAMYTPRAFSETTLSRLHDLMEQESFALIISTSDGLPEASHLPLLLDREQGPYGTIRGHLARSNSQWKTLVDQRALVVYSGPHCYISPTWYEDDNVVPTWNYVAVHAVGRFRLIEEQDSLKQLIRQMTDHYESILPTPWAIPSGEFYDQLFSQVVGFQIEIESLTGKWKLSQNHSPKRQRALVRRLREHGGHQETAIAELMDQNILPH